MKKTSSAKRTQKSSDSPHTKIGRKIGGCDCNSASEMCSCSTPTKARASTRASRTCSGRGTKTIAKAATTKRSS